MNFYSYAVTKLNGYALSDKEKELVLDYFIKNIDAKTLMLYHNEITYFITENYKNFSSKNLKIKVNNV